MKKHDIGCKILMTTGFILIAAGIYGVVFNNTPLFSIINRLMDPMFWGASEALSNGSLKFKIFTWDFLGMLHIIWGVHIVYIVKYGLMKKEAWAWKCTLISVITLLLVDMYLTMSIKQNTFIPVTIFFAALFIVPLIMTKGVLRKIDIRNK
jgi:hypothetical protein